VWAYMWFNIAAAYTTGDEQKLAIDYRDMAARCLSVMEIAEAQKLSREWKPREK